MKKFILGIFVLLVGVFVMSFSTTTQAQTNAINLSGDCLRWVWVGCFDVEKLLFPESPIDQMNERRTVMTITQDIVFGATYMVWTVLTIIIIYCGLRYIFASGWWDDTSKYRRWLVDAAIWALLVWWAYAIIRLIQYIAKW